MIDVATTSHSPSYLDELRDDYQQLRNLGQKVEWLDGDAMRRAGQLADLHRRVVAQGPRRDRRPGAARVGLEGRRDVAGRAHLRRHQGHVARQGRCRRAGQHAARRGCAPARWRWPPTRSSRCCKRIGHYVAPVYDYCMVTEPLSDGAAGRHRLGQPSGPSATSPTSSTTTGSPRTTASCGAATTPSTSGAARSTPSSRAAPRRGPSCSKHFFDTFPQLEGLKFTHTWGGAIDTCSRFCVFWGQAMAGPRRVRARLHRARRRVHALRRRGDARPARRQAQSRATQTEFVQEQAAAVPARAVPLRRHPGHPLVARPRGPHRQAQPLAAHASTGSASASTASCVRRGRCP